MDRDCSCRRIFGCRSDIMPSDDQQNLGGGRRRLNQLRAGYPDFPFKDKGYIQTNPYGSENRIVLQPRFYAYRNIRGAYL